LGHCAKRGFDKSAGLPIWTSSIARRPQGEAQGWAESIPPSPPTGIDAPMQRA